MGYIDRMRVHLESMQEFDRKITSYQNETRDNLTTEAIKRKDPALTSPSWPLVLQARVQKYLKEDPWFQDLTGDRTFHTTRAALYAAASQAESAAAREEARD